MKNVQEVKLSSGWTVRCRSVPPLAQAGMMNRPEYRYPPPPKITLKTLAGTEQADAPEDSEEARAYWEACREVDAAQEDAITELSFSYGVMSWSQDGKKWETDPPKGWKLDPTLAEAVPPTKNERAAFIMYGLILTSKDFNNVSRAILNPDMQPITSEEVGAAEDSFQDQVEGDES